MFNQLSYHAKLYAVAGVGVFAVFIVGMGAIFSIDLAVAEMYTLVAKVEPATPSEIGSLYERLNYSASVLVVALPMSVIAIVLGTLSLKNAGRMKPS